MIPREAFAQSLHWNARLQINELCRPGWTRK